MAYGLLLVTSWCSIPLLCPVTTSPCGPAPSENPHIALPDRVDPWAADALAQAVSIQVEVQINRGSCFRQSPSVSRAASNLSHGVSVVCCFRFFGRSLRSVGRAVFYSAECLHDCLLPFTWRSGLRQFD